jgi:hypothetical protein
MALNLHVGMAAALRVPLRHFGKEWEIEDEDSVKRSEFD